MLKVAFLSDEDWRWLWTVGVLPFPGHRHLSGPEVGSEHQLPHQEGTADDVLPATAEETCQRR